MAPAPASPQVAMFGMAFAAADILFQLDGDTIEHLVGAVQAVTGRQDAEMLKTRWIDWVDPADKPLVRAALLGVDESVRRGPFIVRLGPGSGRSALLTLRQSPVQAQRVCGALVAVTGSAEDAPSGVLLSRAAFEQTAARLIEVARQTGQGLELAFVHLDEGAVAEDDLIGGLRAESLNGAAAGGLGPGRFAVLRTPDGDSQRLASRLSRVLATDVAAQVLRVDAGMPADKAMRSIRLAIDRFLDSRRGALPANASEVLEQAMRAAVGEAHVVRRLIDEGRFTLAYQPVVDLKTRRVTHHEVLVRFSDAQSPAAQLQMAEAFDLIGDLDAAVLERAVAELARANRDVRFAVNVSGSTVAEGGLADRLDRLLSIYPKARGRLLLEMTETAIIDDLDRANRHIQALRDRGIPVCLDDFGAGSASFNYLQNLHVDVLKIDGAYIRGLVEHGREAAMIRRLVQLCADLKIKTVAEMVESPEVEALAIKAGVDYAQGWLYGRAASEPLLQLPEPITQRHRRHGAVETWS